MKRLKIIFMLLLVLGCSNNNNDFNPDLSGTGTGGSLAKFTIVNNQVLVLGSSSVKQFSILPNGSLSLLNETFVGSNLETIFPYGERVLVGSNSAVYFLEFGQNNLLENISSYQHLTACDPVVASGELAYSTLRSSGCRFNSQEVIDVIDFSDITKPELIASYETTAPYGLAATDDFLFVCENGGVSMYDRGVGGNLISIGFTTIDSSLPLDIIVRDGFLVVRTDDGIYNLSFDATGELTIIGQLTR